MLSFVDRPEPRSGGSTPAGLHSVGESLSNALSPSLTERQQPSKKRYTAGFLKVREAEQRTPDARSLRRAFDSHVIVGQVTALPCLPAGRAMLL